MKVISPITLTDAMVTSSTASEPAAGETTWLSAGTYALGDQRIRTGTHRIYECVQAHTGRTALPEVDTAYWLDIGPTNKWSMFDGAVNTQTSVTSPLTVKVVPGTIFNAMALLELDGTAVTVTQKETPGGTTIFTETRSLDGTVITDWYMYFFEPYALADIAVFDALLPYASSEITVSITGTGTVSCGVLAIGTVYEVGSTQWGVSAGIIDYSSKTTDSYGTTTLVQRAYSKRMDAKLSVPATEINRVHKLLSGLRATPSVWIGSDSDAYAPLVIYGFYRDFALEIAYPTHSLCSLQIEGLI